MAVGLDALDADQRQFVEAHVKGGRVVADHSWGQTDTVVLEVVAGPCRVIVKAGGPSNGHIAREIRGHREWAAPWRATGSAARMIAADERARVLITTYLEGQLVEGTPAQDDPGIYEQAGRLSAVFHDQYATADPTWNARLRDRTLRFLSMPHRIHPRIAEQVRQEVAGWPVGGATVVPTHGDWQPRNWLDDHGVRADLTSLLGGVDHGHTDAVLDGVGRVVELQLGGDCGLGAVSDAVEANQGGVADQVGHVVGDAHMSSLEDFSKFATTWLAKPGSAGDRAGLLPEGKADARGDAGMRRVRVVIRGGAARVSGKMIFTGRRVGWCIACRGG